MGLWVHSSGVEFLLQRWNCLKQQNCPQVFLWLVIYCEIEIWSEVSNLSDQTSRLNTLDEDCSTVGQWKLLFFEGFIRKSIVHLQCCCLAKKDWLQIVTTWVFLGPARGLQHLKRIAKKVFSRGATRVILQKLRRESNLNKFYFFPDFLKLWQKRGFIDF